MFSRIARRRIAQGLLGLLVFVQAALAVACDWRSTNAAQAIAAAMPGCHDMRVENTNLCLAHCLAADQATVDQEIAVPLWAPAAVLSVLLPEPAVARAPQLVYVLPRAGAPPPRILHHSLLI